MKNQLKLLNILYNIELDLIITTLCQNTTRQIRRASCQIFADIAHSTRLKVILVKSKLSHVLLAAISKLLQFPNMDKAAVKHSMLIIPIRHDKIHEMWHKITNVTDGKNINRLTD